MGTLIESQQSCCSTSPATGSYQLEGCAGGVPYVQITQISASSVTVSWINMTTGVVSTTAPAGFVVGACTDVKPVLMASDEFVATAGQTTFNLTSTPIGTVLVFRNGVRIPVASVTVTGSVATYVPAGNNGFALVAGDRINIDYTKAI